MSDQAASRAISWRRKFFGSFPALAFAIFILPFSPASDAYAARLGGAYYVDDAEIGKPGSCEFESWSSFAANGDRIAVFSPACVVNFGVPVELGTNIVNLRSDGQGDTIATLTAKTVPIPIGPSGFGLAIAGAAIYDPLHQTGNGLIVNVPMSFDFSKNLRLNVNFGAQYNDGVPRGLFATGGVGVSWNFVPQWSIISEVFAIMGSGQRRGSKRAKVALARVCVVDAQGKVKEAKISSEPVALVTFFEAPRR
jgi:hypothetical protein